MSASGRGGEPAACVRLARPGDAEAVQAIYAPIVRHTTVSFEWEPPTPAELAARIERVLLQHPWLVLEQEGRVLGYAYATRARERAAYQWSAEVSVYVHPAVRRAGVGRALYGALLELLRLQGYCVAYAVVPLPNPGSVALHEALGFRRAAFLPAAGYKLGAWVDVGWWRLELRRPPAEPRSPTPLPALLGSPHLEAVLQRGLEGLRLP